RHSLTPLITSPSFYFFFTATATTELSPLSLHDALPICTTAVTEDGQSGSFSAQDVSVGQRLQLFGTFGTDSSGNRTLDASSGSARLMLTPLWGQFISSASGVVTVKLQRLAGIDPSMFNFAGTGSSAANDANASAYQVQVPAALQLPPLNAGSPLPFFG